MAYQQLLRGDRLMEEAAEIVGHFDGYRGGKFMGWAWRPNDPDNLVTIEVVADGYVIGETIASLYRPDLRAASIGNGFHGYELIANLNLDRHEPIKVLVRAKDGPTLRFGETKIGGKPSQEDQSNPEFQAFVAAVLGRPLDTGEAAPVEVAPRTNFIVYCPRGSDPVAATISGGPEYSYSFVLQMFLPVLERFGIVHEVANPSAEVDALHETHLSRGETSLFLSFAPPHRTTLGLRCPTIPVIAWEFPTIPNVVWEDEVRHDWRYVLRQTGRAITLSGFAAQAVKNAMGTDFPVVSIPAPVWDRQRAEDGGPRPHPGQIEIEIDGIVVDTRALALTVGMPIPLRPERDTGIATLRLDGVVFTSVLSPKDGRKNWSDILTAFAAAFRDTPDATLVFKMIGADPSYWWWEFHDTLSRLPAFACRVVAVSGYLDDSRYAALIDGSHWVVNASLAEGLCLPLLEFMSAGRPAIAPSHTAMADYIDSTNALPVASDEEFCGWPQDSRLQFTTTRHRIIWSALEAAYREGYRMVRSDPARYRALCEAAERSMRAFCGDDVIAAKLDSFLGLCSDSPPSAALSGLMVAEATA